MNLRSTISLYLLLTSFFLFGQDPYAIVLGTAQDGGFPHIGCQAECQLAFEDPTLKRYVVSLALVDPASKQWWMFEATPDFDDQLQYFQGLTKGEYDYLPSGIFITHAHIGHYTGLMSLGREALGAKEVSVFVLPKMKNFLEGNGPWSQLVKLKNIVIQELDTFNPMVLSENIVVKTFTVPHRDEYSETAGFMIDTKKKYLFIPDVDKWEKWKKNIIEEVNNVDYAFLDGSFFADGELPFRSILEVPHPFVSETMTLFENEPSQIKSKVHFIHFNHTNPLLFDPIKSQEVLDNGFRLAKQGETY